MLRGFRQFLLRGNFVDLATAFVVGAAFNSVVQSMVKDFVTPLLAAIGGKPNLSYLYFTINNSRFDYGDFLNSLISFLIEAALIYFLVVLPINQLISLARSRRPEDPTTKKCPFCLSEIPIGAIRCPECTSQLPKKG